MQHPKVQSIQTVVQKWTAAQRTRLASERKADEQYRNEVTEAERPLVQRSNAVEKQLRDASITPMSVPSYWEDVRDTSYQVSGTTLRGEAALAEAVAAADRARGALRQSQSRYHIYLEEQARRRAMFQTLALITGLILTIAAVVGYGFWTKGQGDAALARDDFEEAEQHYMLVNSYFGWLYPEGETLLKEVLYHQGIAALEAGDFESAREFLSGLNYKNSNELLNETQAHDDSSTITEGGDVDVFSLGVGDCFNTDATDEVGDVAGVPCEEPHDHEVYALVDYNAEPDAAWPGQDAIDNFSDEACVAEFEEFIGVSYAESIYYISYLQPTEQSWEQGDREVICMLNDQDGKLEGSKANSRE